MTHPSIRPNARTVFIERTVLRRGGARHYGAGCRMNVAFLGLAVHPFHAGPALPERYRGLFPAGFVVRDDPARGRWRAGDLGRGKRRGGALTVAYDLLIGGSPHEYRRKEP